MSYTKVRDTDEAESKEMTIAGWFCRLKSYAPILLALLAAENFDRSMNQMR